MFEDPIFASFLYAVNVVLEPVTDAFFQCIYHLLLQIEQPCFHVRAGIHRRYELDSFALRTDHALYNCVSLLVNL
jgi:hypothetical protein